MKLDPHLEILLNSEDPATELANARYSERCAAFEYLLLRIEDLRWDIFELEHVIMLWSMMTGYEDPFEFGFDHPFTEFSNSFLGKDARIVNEAILRVIDDLEQEQRLAAMEAEDDLPFPEPKDQDT